MSHDDVGSFRSEDEHLNFRVGCVLTVINGGFSVLIFRLFISPWSSGFCPPLCYQASSALSHKYYLWICHPLSLTASGSPPRFGFMALMTAFNTRAGGLPWVRRTTSPYPVQLHVGSILPDIRPRLFTPARPSPQRHIAGSLFATYMGSASCFLRTPRFRQCPCLVGVVLPSGNGGTTLCSHKGTASASCQAHVNYHRQRRWLEYSVLKGIIFFIVFS